MRVASFTLVHSPLVGPVTWSRVASELQRRGHDVVVPSLVNAASIGRWQECVDVVVQACSGVGDVVVVGHSGAGPLLPLIACRLDAPPRLSVFVDAGVPREQGDASLVPDQFLGHLRQLAIEGRLPKWSEWFGPDAMRAIVPDPELREAIVAELPRLPLSYFEQHVPMPEGWADLRYAYILLSEPYRADAEAARSRGWYTAALPGAHLDIVTRPSEVADALVDAVTA
jgi:hypothetical protein